jgi:pimeloyl-ACP methyl ester carboxylesterase
MTSVMRIPSTDGVEVAVHDLGGTGRTLLLSHATGFHGHCYVPIARALADSVHSYALDYRGHGLTDVNDSWSTDWQAYGDDVTAVARALRERSPEQPLIAFGHSMGGAGLLMAAHRDPSLFDVIIAFEPIVFPHTPSDLPADPEASPLVQGARRRRARFASLEEAIANYSAKPPIGTFTPEAIRLYVEHGLRPEDEGNQDGGVVLRCAPDHEARTYVGGGQHATFAVLPEIATRVIVVAGRADLPGPATIAPLIAEQLPNVEFIQSEEWDHFAPMVVPEEMADLIAAHL